MRLGATIAALAAAASLFAAATAQGAAPQRMQVTEDEWSLVLSRQKLKPGRAVIEVFNLGQDAHDLVLQRKAKGAKAVVVPKLDHFMRKQVSVKLVKGVYALWCSLPRHRERGMSATLRVR
jgi:plastocyanin